MTVLTHIRAAVSRALASVAVTVGSFFDRELDSLIGHFLTIDHKLEDFIARQNAIRQAAAEAAAASTHRIIKVIDAEVDLNNKLDARAELARAQTDRAVRIRDRISSLLN